MTEILLNAILNLFAIQAAIQGEKDPGKARAFLDRYLRRQLRLSQPDAYLDLFEAALALHQERTSLVRNNLLPAFFWRK